MSEQVIWEATSEDGWRAVVTRIDEGHGRLRVEPLDGGPALLVSVVALAYGARFGPDVADVENWAWLADNVIHAASKR